MSQGALHRTRSLSDRAGAALPRSEVRPRARGGFVSPIAAGRIRAHQAVERREQCAAAWRYGPFGGAQLAGLLVRCGRGRSGRLQRARVLESVTPRKEPRSSAQSHRARATRDRLPRGMSVGASSRDGPRAGGFAVRGSGVAAGAAPTLPLVVARDHPTRRTATMARKRKPKRSSASNHASPTTDRTSEGARTTCRKVRSHTCR
jgi:hypothetical protein